MRLVFWKIALAAAKRPVQSRIWLEVRRVAGNGIHGHREDLAEEQFSELSSGSETLSKKWLQNQ